MQKTQARRQEKEGCEEGGFSDVRKEGLMDGGREGGREGVFDVGKERMLREAARREFIAIITLDGLTEAALHTHCLAPVYVCGSMKSG